MMYTLILETEKLAIQARANGLNAIKNAAADEIQQPHEGLAIVMADKDACGMARAMVDAGGVKDSEVEYIEGSEYEGGIESLVSAGIDAIMEAKRDIYFNEIRSLYHAKNDPALQERIPAGPNWAERNILFRRRELIIVAGAYGCGKSTLNHYLAMYWLKGRGAFYEEGHEKQGQRRSVPVWLCTWEDDPVEQKEQIMRHVTGGQCGKADAKDIATAEQMQREIMHTRPEVDVARNFSWWLSRARYLNKNFGTNFFVCDPWSEFEHEMGFREQETVYVKRIMHEITMLTIELNCIVVVATHITKAKYSDDMGIKPFRVADSMGSVQFGSTATRGICVSRVSSLVGNQDHTVLYFDKTKISSGPNTMGKDRELVALRFLEDIHAFDQDMDATGEAAGSWGCSPGGLMGGTRVERKNQSQGNARSCKLKPLGRPDFLSSGKENDGSISFLPDYLTVVSDNTKDKDADKDKKGDDEK